MRSVGILRRYMDQVGDKAMLPRGGKFDMIDALERAQKERLARLAGSALDAVLATPVPAGFHSLFIPFLFVSPLLVWSARTVH